MLDFREPLHPREDPRRLVRDRPPGNLFRDQPLFPERPFREQRFNPEPRFNPELRRNMLPEYQRRNSKPQGLTAQDARQHDDELAYLRARVTQQDAELRRSERRTMMADPGPEFVPRENRRLESLSGRRNYASGGNYLRDYSVDRASIGRRHDRLDYPNPLEFAEERKPRNLRPTDIMMFDPTKHSAAFFIRRFRHIAELEGSGPVLRILPMCLERDALEWHNGLSSRVRQEMNQDLSIWEDELLREYRPNRFESLKKAKIIKFRFDDTFMSLSQYLTRKTNHLHDTGMDDEDIIIRYLWQGLNANLALATLIREEGDMIEAFNRRVRNNEVAAKRVHDLNRPRKATQSATNSVRV